MIGTISSKKPLDAIFDILDRYRYLPLVLLISGMIIIMESFIFIYSSLGGYYSHLSILLLFTAFFIGILDFAILIIYSKKRGWVTEGIEEGGMAPYLVKINRYIPISNMWVSIGIGILLISAIWVLMLIGVGNPKIGDSDVLLILTGIMFIIYPFIPKKYSLERDFILTFFVFLLIAMALIPFLFDLNSEGFTYYFLTMPLHNMLNLIGIRNLLVPPSTIHIIDPLSKIKSPIIIARSCSGIYSFSIFTSAFVSFVLVIYRKIDLRAVLFLSIGIALAYLGNIIRMTVVVLAGYYYGSSTLEWTHANLGYLIFFAWMGFFWMLLYKFLIKAKKEKMG